jgi:hypothetical protein
MRLILVTDDARFSIRVTHEDAGFSYSRHAVTIAAGNPVR